MNRYVYRNSPILCRTTSPLRSGLNCHYLIDVPMSLVGFPNRSSKDGFVFIGFKKPTTNAKTISTMCDFDHAAISLHQTLFALLTLFIRIYIFLFFIKFAA